MSTTNGHMSHLMVNGMLKRCWGRSREEDEDTAFLADNLLLAHGKFERSVRAAEMT